MNGTIKVYTADVETLTDAQRFQQLYARVSAGRREKVDRLKLEKNKCLSLGAGALLEAALAAEGLSDFTMTTEHNGKPRLAHVQNVHFSISHAGTKVMCAVSDSEIGCDVERIAECNMQIAKRFFHAGEYAALMQCRDRESQNRLFFRYWTLKESFMKATGLGFQLPLDAFCIVLSDGTISVRQSVDDRAYYFGEFDLRDGFQYAVCSAEKPLDKLALLASSSLQTL